MSPLTDVGGLGVGSVGLHCRFLKGLTGRQGRYGYKCAVPVLFLSGPFGGPIERSLGSVGVGSGKHGVLFLSLSSQETDWSLQGPRISLRR